MTTKTTTGSVGKVAEPMDKTANTSAEVVRLATAVKTLIEAMEPRRHIEAMRELKVAFRAYEVWKAGA